MKINRILVVLVIRIQMFTRKISFKIYRQELSNKLLPIKIIKIPKKNTILLRLVSKASSF